MPKNSSVFAETVEPWLKLEGTFVARCPLTPVVYGYEIALGRNRTAAAKARSGMLS